MKRIKSIFVSLSVTCLFFALSCEKGSLDTDTPSWEGEDVVHRTVAARIAAPGVEVLDLGGTQTKTMLNYKDVGKDTTHPVWWTLGDKVYSYAQSGVYMSYVLKREDLVDVIPAYPDRGYKANIEVIYRLGDAWYSAYFLGSGVGPYSGRRTETGFKLLNGIPRSQNGEFSPYHVCIGRDVPEVDEFIFSNLQSYVGFKTEGNDVPAVGTIEGEKIGKIELTSVSKEKMAGDMDIDYNGGWRYQIGDRREAADSMITVTPVGGYFKKDHGYYYVAVPVRKYGKGMMINFYNTSGRRISYVKTPSVTLNFSQIYDCTDILQYVVVLMRDLELYYDGEKITSWSENQDPETHPTPTIPTVTVEEGHVGKFTYVVKTVATTDQSLSWTVDTGGEDILNIAQDGSFVAGTNGTTEFTVSSNDGSGVALRCIVKVIEKRGLGAGDYTTEPFNFDRT